MRYYAKQPNGYYCAYSTATNDLSIINMTKDELYEEINSSEGKGNIVSFNELLSMLKSNYPCEDLTLLHNDLKSIGYENAKDFLTNLYCKKHDLEISENTNKEAAPTKKPSKYTFDYIKDNGLLLYEYIRGSQAYGLALPTSDEDRSAVFCLKNEDLIGLPDFKIDQVNDERNDVVWYELEKYVDLLCKANPTMLESLFVPERCVVYMHPAFKTIYDHRQDFVTKETFASFCGYAKSQIEKARGLNKKIVKPVNKLENILAFCHVPRKQGSQKVENYLRERGLKQRFCGLNNVPHMRMVLGLYYDYGTHLRCEYDKESFNKLYWNGDKDFKLFMKFMKNNGVLSFTDRLKIFFSIDKYAKILDIVQPKGYHGIMRDDGKSNEVRLDSLVKGDEPLCFMEYNKDGYTTHCKEYKEYQDWVKHRNPQRFLENRDKEFDRKNMMHCARLLNMGIEIAKTGQVNVDRTNIDRDYLLNIRLGNATYEELMDHLSKQFFELKLLIPECTLPETVDREKVNQILLDIRKEMNK